MSATMADIEASLDEPTGIATRQGFDVECGYYTKTSAYLCEMTMNKDGGFVN